MHIKGVTSHTWIPRCTNECVLLHKWMRHVKRIWVMSDVCEWHTFICVTWLVHMSHVTHIRVYESGHSYTRIWVTLLTYEQVMSHKWMCVDVGVSGHAHAWVMSVTHMSHITCMSHVAHMIHVAHMNESRLDRSHVLIVHDRAALHMHTHVWIGHVKHTETARWFVPKIYIKKRPIYTQRDLYIHKETYKRDP